MEWKTEDAVTLVKIACDKHHLAPGALQTIKSVCKKSTDAVSAVHRKLWAILTSSRQKSAQKRETALQILSELFTRSKTMRQLVVPKCDLLAEATIFSGLKDANDLRKLAIRTFRAWEDKFKRVYDKLDCLMKTLRNKGVNFEEEYIETGSENVPEEVQAGNSSRLLEIIDETVHSADQACAEARTLFEIIIPLSPQTTGRAGSKNDSKSQSSSGAIVLELNFSKIRIKREGAVELVESQLRPVIAQLEKLRKRLQMWIGGDMFIEPSRLERIVCVNSSAKQSISKYKSLSFYDDSEDEEEEFEDVTTDEEAAEAEYMKGLFQPKQNKIKEERRNASKSTRIPVNELAHHSKTTETFVDTRNAVSAQLVERHHFTSPDSEVNLDRAKSMASTIYYTTEDIAIEEKKITRTCRAPMGLPNGKLCPRMDKIKCPFHGKIVDRDVHGVVVDRCDAPKTSPQKEKVLKDYSRKRSTNKDKSTVKQRLAKKIFKK